MLTARFIAPLVILAAPAAFAAGWWSMGHAPLPDVVAAVRLNAPVVPRPGWQTASAAKALAQANPAPALAPTAVAEAHPGPPPPPPPDIAVLFRRDVAAVISGPDAQPRILLAYAGKGPRRTLRRGDRYRDGWRVASLEPRRAVLRRGSESRTVDLFGPAPAIDASGAPIVLARAEPVEVVRRDTPVAKPTPQQVAAAAVQAAQDAQNARRRAFRGGQGGGPGGGGQGGGPGGGGQGGGGFGRGGFGAGGGFRGGAGGAPAPPPPQ